MSYSCGILLLWDLNPCCSWRVSSRLRINGDVFHLRLGMQNWDISQLFFEDAESKHRTADTFLTVLCATAACIHQSLLSSLRSCWPWRQTRTRLQRGRKSPGQSFMCSILEDHWDPAGWWCKPRWCDLLPVHPLSTHSTNNNKYEQNTNTTSSD